MLKDLILLGNVNHTLCHLVALLSRAYPASRRPAFPCSCRGSTLGPALSTNTCLSQPDPPLRNMSMLTQHSCSSDLCQPKQIKWLFLALHFCTIYIHVFLVHLKTYLSSPCCVTLCSVSDVHPDFQRGVLVGCCPSQHMGAGNRVETVQGGPAYLGRLSQKGLEASIL